MNKKALAAVIIVIAAAVSSAYAYQSFYLVENADVHIRDSNVIIDNSNVTLGENNTFTNTPEPTITPEPTTQPTPQPTPTPAQATTINKTFIVYRWTLTNGTVTLELLKSYYHFVGIQIIPVLFTYKIGETSGLAAYDAEWHGRSYEADYMKNVVERFEKNLSSVAEWTKTEQTIEIEANLNGIQLQYADAFD